MSHSSGGESDSSVQGQSGKVVTSTTSANGDLAADRESRVPNADVLLSAVNGVPRQSAIAPIQELSKAPSGRQPTVAGRNTRGKQAQSKPRLVPASGGVSCGETPGRTRYQLNSRPPLGSPKDMLPPDLRLKFFQEQLSESWSEEAMCYLQDADRDLSKVKVWFREKYRPTWEEVAKENHVVKSWWYRADQLLFSDNGILYIRWEGAKPTDPPLYKVVAVSTMFSAILSQLHDAKTAGHLGQKKTIYRVKHSRFYWPGMTVFARKWVGQCVVCASRKNPKYSRRVPMQVYRVGSPMDRVSLDLLGPFRPITRGRHQLILTLTDHASRWVEAYPLRDGGADEIARKVVDFCCRFGLPLELHGDNGKNVDGRVIRQVCHLLGIRKTHTTPYHPEGNAITERENSVIKNMLAAYVNEKGDNWDEFLNVVMLGYRTSVHRVLKESPAFLMLGRRPRIPLDAMVGDPPEQEYKQLNPTKYVEDLAEAMLQAQATVSKHVGTHLAYSKKTYDRIVRSERLTVGMKVWLRVFPKSIGRSKCLTRPWLQNWVITAKFSEANYRIQKSIRHPGYIVGGNRLKRQYGPISGEATQRLYDSLQPPSADS
jgi:hypothetical protein